MPTPFSLTFDYLCPFARNVHEHVLTAVAAGADLDVTYVPFSLAQSHLEDGAADVWDVEHPDAGAGVLALQAGLAVRDEFPEVFPSVHRELFAARHDHGLDLRDPQVVRDALVRGGADADEVMDVVATRRPLKVLAAEHTSATADHEVWGVPTFIGTDRATFVRLMTRPGEDAAVSTRTITRILDLLEGFPELNEFKQVNVAA